MGVSTEGADVHSVGNTLLLHQTALIEAFNLKAAIEFQLKNRKNPSVMRHCRNGGALTSFLFAPPTVKGAQEALTDMPPRSQEVME